MRNVVKDQINHRKELGFHLKNRRKPGTHQGGGSMQSNDLKNIILGK